MLNCSEHAKANAPAKWIRATRREYDFSRGSGDAWWTVSEKAAQYLPALSLDNESVKTFLQAHGFPNEDAGDAKRARADGLAREYDPNAIAAMVVGLGVVLAGAAILADAVAVTAFRSIAEESRAGPKRLPWPRGKRKVE